MFQIALSLIKQTGCMSMLQEGGRKGHSLIVTKTKRLTSGYSRLEAIDTRTARSLLNKLAVQNSIAQMAFPVSQCSTSAHAGNLYKAVARLREYCRQVEAEEASNSRNKIHQTWAQPQRFPVHFCHCSY